MRPDFFYGGDSSRRAAVRSGPPRRPASLEYDQGFLAGVRNRTTTLLNWFWSDLTFSGGIRLITRSERAPDRS
jgi:hypothetical protein